MSQSIKTKKKSKKFYINNQEFYLEIIKSKENKQLTKRAIELFYILAHNVINVMEYHNPEDKADILHFGLMDMFAYWERFDPNKSKNAFGYFTEIFKMGCAKGWNIIRKNKKNEIPIEGFSADGDDKIYSI